MEYSLVIIANESLIFSVGGAGNLIQTSNIELNQYMHVVGVYDGSQIKLYINGNLEASSSLNGVFSDEGLIKTFGHSSFIGSNHFFEGKIDEYLYIEYWIK